MSGTRGPRTGRIPPHIQERVDRKGGRAASRPIRGNSYARLLLGALLGLLLFIAGFVLGRVTTTDSTQQALQMIGSHQSALERATS